MPKARPCIGDPTKIFDLTYAERLAWDHIMALHRLAYRMRCEHDETYDDYHKALLERKAQGVLMKDAEFESHTYWRVAGKALDAGMPAELAFPYAGDLIEIENNEKE